MIRQVACGDRDGKEGEAMREEEEDVGGDPGDAIKKV